MAERTLRWKDSSQEIPEEGQTVVGFWAEGGIISVCTVTIEEPREIVCWWDELASPVALLDEPPSHWIALPPLPPHYVP